MHNGISLFQKIDDQNMFACFACMACTSAIAMTTTREKLIAKQAYSSDFVIFESECICRKTKLLLWKLVTM